MTLASGDPRPLSRPGGLALTVRASEWWEYKLAPALTLAYATALMLQVPVAELWPAMMLLLAALVPGAAWVGVLNDVCDRADDAVAGKPNRSAGRSHAFVATLLGAAVAAGAVVAYRWRHDALLLPAYLGAWLAFALYSLPPFRWKSRGALGVVADASGAHLFPALVAVTLVFRAAQRPPSVTWIAAVAVWALAYGLRGILRHQLGDAANDARSGVRTFATLHPADVVMRLGRRVVLPLELLGLLALLVQMGSVVPFLFLALHALGTIARLRWWKIGVTVVETRPRHRVLLHEFYEVLLPVAILLAAARYDARALLVLAAHLAAFPTQAGRTWREGGRLLAAAARGLRRRMRSGTAVTLASPPPPNG